MMRAAVFDEWFFERGFFHPGEDRARRFRGEKCFEVVGRDEVESAAALCGDEAGAPPGEGAGGEFGVGRQPAFDGVNGRKREDRAARGMRANLGSDAGDAVGDPFFNRTERQAIR